MDRSFTLGLRGTRVRSFDSGCINPEDLPLSRAAVWVCDEATRQFLPSGADPVVVLSRGEAAKNWDSVLQIIDAALSVPLGRDDLVIALGGGVVCDTAAFAASVYMRGCGLVLIPSTLLSMIDASLGGKTGIDYGSYKNIIGSFYPAAEILIYPFLLKSLPESEYLSGLAEVLKHALLEESSLFADLSSLRKDVLERDVRVLNDLIPRSLAVKGRIVEADPTEEGIRAQLNLGHTFGHALESLLGLGVLPHGFAVAWGIARAMEAGVSLGATDPAYAAEVKDFFTAYGYNLGYRIPDLGTYLDILERDKKRKNGEVNFVLQRHRGDTFLTPLSEELLKKVLTPFSDA
ncbi:3-dehydroquinate synthase family protein [Marispirochaeta aestuarii]|uniref:3-dehydroquinate synthase n=1 Tax=Marispirochaeta aestuarii TaxID=1963862 RepID=UPI0029C7B9D6|nr:3-dehydroquinate synthase family protein [Marispirochaeta aestuarii]